MAVRPDGVNGQLASPRVAPGTKAVGGIRRILLATDLSPASDGAAEQALDLARDLRADLLAVSVIDEGGDRSTGSGPLARIRSDREVAAQGLVAKGRSRGVDVQFLIWDGDPGQSIVDAAVAEQVDLVVVGSHGRGAVGRFLVGSVSDYVVRNAPCPVLVVRSRPIV